MLAEVGLVIWNMMVEVTLITDHTEAEMESIIVNMVAEVKLITEYIGVED